MSDRDRTPGDTARRSNSSMSWLMAGAAAVIIILALVFWNTTGEDEASIAEQSPVVEDQESAGVDDDEVVQDTSGGVAAPEAAVEGTGEEGGGALREAGEGVAAGPESPLGGAESDQDNAVADEAARENRIIQEQAEQTEGRAADGSSIEDANRIADEVEGERPAQ